MALSDVPPRSKKLSLRRMDVVPSSSLHTRKTSRSVGVPWKWSAAEAALSRRRRREALGAKRPSAVVARRSQHRSSTWARAAAGTSCTRRWSTRCSRASRPASCRLASGSRPSSRRRAPWASTCSAVAARATRGSRAMSCSRASSARRSPARQAYAPSSPMRCSTPSERQRASMPVARQAPSAPRVHRGALTPMAAKRSADSPTRRVSHSRGLPTLSWSAGPCAQAMASG